MGDMSGVITLDLDELAGEWAENLAIIGDDQHPDEYVQEREECQRYEELCDQLGLTPREPDTLRWYNRENNPTLIREDTFEEYAQEFAEDIYGDGVREMSSFIDWEKFADGLRIDYYTIEYDGHTWLRRA